MWHIWAKIVISHVLLPSVFAACLRRPTYHAPARDPGPDLGFPANLDGPTSQWHTARDAIVNAGHVFIRLQHHKQHTYLIDTKDSSTMLLCRARCTSSTTVGMVQLCTQQACLLSCAAQQVSTTVGTAGVTRVAITRVALTNAAVVERAVPTCMTLQLRNASLVVNMCTLGQCHSAVWENSTETAHRMHVGTA
jgi:hypothetical protein